MNQKKENAHWTNLHETPHFFFFIRQKMVQTALQIFFMRDSMAKITPIHWLEYYEKKEEWEIKKRWFLYAFLIGLIGGYLGNMLLFPV